MSQPQQPPEQQLSGWEAVLAAAVAVALAAWLAKVRDKVMAPFRLFGLIPDPAALFALRGEWERHVDDLLDSIVDIARIGWEAAAPGLPFNPDDPMLRDQISLTRNLLIRVPDELYASIVKQIAAGVNAGEPNETIAGRIDDLLDYSGSQNWPGRAQVIANTEVARAYNMGAQAAASRLSARGTDVFKQWRSRDDSRVRAAHVAADKQTVAARQPFIVGGEPLMFPGDPRGLPHNVINCRCLLKIVRKP